MFFSLKKPFSQVLMNLISYLGLINDWVIFLPEWDVIKSLNKTDSRPMHRVPIPTRMNFCVCFLKF